MEFGKIIRYYSKEKFEWLLCDGGLYVNPASRQSDDSEGLYDHNCVYKFLEGGEFAKKLDFERLNGLAQGQMHHARDNSYLSSWYFGDDEKQHMWDGYASDGVLIVSSVLSLKTHLPDPLEHASDFCNVVYDDERKDAESINPLNFKNSKYEDEKEFRLIFDLHKYSILTGYQEEKFRSVLVDGVPSYENASIISGISEKGLSQKLSVICPKGVGHILKYDLNLIIDEIRVNPGCTNAEMGYFEKIAREAGLKAKISSSHLK